MGKQHSKSNLEKQSTQCSSNSSVGANSEKNQFQPISCSPEKFKLISRNRKIKTTCSLKSPQKTQPQTLHTQYQDSLQSFDKVLQKIVSTFLPTNETVEVKLAENATTQQLSGQLSRNPDIDRINSLFSFCTPNLNQDEFNSANQSILSSNQVLVLKWKDSVNTIISDTEQKHTYCQGYLLVCAIIRLYFTQNLTLLFLKKLLKKVASLLTCPEGYNSFSENLNEKCKEKFPLISHQLELKDLDFQFIYANWILGLFSNILSKQTCIQVWFKLSISQNTLQIMEEIIFACMSCIEENLSFGLLEDCSNQQKNENRLNNEEISKTIDDIKISKIINDIKISEIIN